MIQILPCLTSCEKVFFEGAPVLCSGKRTGPLIRVSDSGHGVSIKAIKNPKIIEVFGNGLVLCKRDLSSNLSLKPEAKFELKPLHEAHIAPERLKILAEGQHFGVNELARVVSEILPDLNKCFEIEILGKNLPDSSRLKPRIVWECKKIGEVLESTPIIAYGTPIQAKIIDGELHQIGKQVPIRLYPEEQRLGDQVSRGLPGVSLGQPVSRSREKGVEFLELLKKRDQDLIGHGVTEFERHSQLQTRIVDHAGEMQVIFSCTNSQTKELRHASAQKVLSAWEHSSPMVQLLDGGWAPIPVDFLNQHAKVLQGLLNGSDSLPAGKATFASISELCDDLDSPIPALITEWRKKLVDFTQVPKIALPNGIRASLRPYQLEAYHWLCFLRDLGMGALLADDMGLGKTLQTISAIERPCLVVAPTSVTGNWLKELNKFRPDLSVDLYHGANRTLSPDSDVIVTSYALARIDLHTLQQRTWKTLVVDEAQAIKNPKSQAAKALGQLNAEFKIALSGTPVENRLDDLWSLYNFLIPGLLGSFKNFQQTFVQDILAGDALASQRLHRRIKPFFLRRTKSEVASELPPRTDIVRYCELSSDERATYEGIRLASRKDVIERLSHDKQALKALELLLRLRQASCHQGLLPGQEIEKEKGSTKLSLLLDCLLQSGENGHKSLVFSQWTSFLDLIELACKELGLKTLRIDGSSKNRQSIVDKFQTDKSEQILLLSLKAAGVGLNLTAAEHVYICDPWWNPAAEDQAADRAHRIGQDKPVLITRLVARDTVEEKILTLQAIKKELAQAVVGVGMTKAGLSRDDLLQLLD